MLKKAHISDIKMRTDSWNYRDEWKKARLSKMTSSKISVICAPEGIGQGGISYISERVAEELTGLPADPEIDTDATRWGLKYENEAIDKFGQLKKLDFVVVQQLITAPGSRFGSTPDALIIIRESTDKTEYEAEPLECKCPSSFKAFMALALCETPQDVKRVNASYYWQCVSQVLEVGSIRGWLTIYHPDFKVGGLNVIEFDTKQSTGVDKQGNKIYPIANDLKLLRERKRLAEEKFYEIRDKMLTKGYA